MIVRYVLENPDYIDRMDYYNDGKDTVQWLLSMDRPDLAERLQKRIDEYLEQWAVGVQKTVAKPEDGDHASADDRLRSIGCVHDPTARGYDRWTHVASGRSVVRQPYLSRPADWENTKNRFADDIHSRG